MNSEFLVVLGLALLPALGNFSGGVLAEWLRPSKIRLNCALHVATGIILAVVSVKVMPEALGTVSAWLFALAFLGGGGVYLLFKAGIDRWQERKRVGVGTPGWSTWR